MYMRAVTIRIVYVGIMSVGILLSATLRQTAVQAAPIAAAPPQTSAPASQTTVTLATIHVRSAVPRVRAGRVAPAPEVASSTEAMRPAAAAGRSGPSLPSLRLDMPYYTFGKMLPRVGKE